MKSKKTVIILLNEDQIEAINNGVYNADRDGVEDLAVQIEYDTSKKEVKRIDVIGTCREQYFETVFKGNKDEVKE